MALTQEQRIEKMHIDLMKHPNFVAYSGVIMIGKTKVCDKTPTAYTNGRDVTYGREFISKLSDAELRGVILHETKHKMYRHLTTWNHLFKQNATKANMACDYVINLEIQEECNDSNNFVELPKCGLLDPKFKGLNSRQVFDMLPDQNGGGGGNGQGSFDEHDWESADEMSEDEKQTLAREVDQALRQGALLAGKLSGNVPREITEAMEAKVNWREVLADFVNSICNDKDNSTWRRPNRRWVDQNVYMPSVVGEAVGRIGVAIDMSGSIGTEEIGQFLGELLSICNHVQPEGIDLLYWDTEVCAHEKYERGEYESIMSSTKPAGGGGTDAACIPKYIEAHKMNPECVLVLTDGYIGDWGDWKHPVFWGMTTDRVAPMGVSVRIQD